MKALLLTCGIIITFMSSVSMLYDYISSDYNKKYPNTFQNVLLFMISVMGLVLMLSSSYGQYTGVHDTRSDVYIITNAEVQHDDGQLIAKYKARSYDTENQVHQTSVVIQFYDAIEKFHVGDTLKLEK